MRDFLNAILAMIGTSSLTDLEYSSIDLDTQAYNIETYNALLGVIDSRETVSSTRDRLRYYFLARGVDIPTSSAAKSNIYIGSVLQ